MAKSAALSDKFFEKLERNFVDYADKVAISYNGDERQITYGELNEISARVHGYLKAKGLKPDDFVMIKLSGDEQQVLAKALNKLAVYLKKQDRTPLQQC